MLSWQIGIMAETMKIGAKKHIFYVWFVLQPALV